MEPRRIPPGRDPLLDALFAIDAGTFTAAVLAGGLIVVVVLVVAMWFGSRRESRRRRQELGQL